MNDENVIYKSLAVNTLDIDQEQGLISGYATTYGNVDLDGDIIKAGAFDNGLALKSQVPLLIQHDYTMPSGLVKLYSDQKAVRFEAHVNKDVQAGREYLSLIKQGAIDSVSIGFTMDSWDYDEQGRRIVDKGVIHELSLVTFPANPQAKITSIKAADYKKMSIKDIEVYLKQGLGLSRNKVQCLISRLKSLSGDPKIEEEDNTAGDLLNNFYLTLQKQL